MKILLSALTTAFLLCSACGDQNDEVPVNSAAARNLSRQLRENFAEAEWFNNVQHITVRGNQVYVSTDLRKYGDKAREICDGVSSLIYADSSTDNETIIINTPTGRALIERKGISDVCR